MHLAGMGWQALGRSVAVGMAYTRHTPCEMKQPMPGTIKHMTTRPLLHNTHLPLAELRTTYSQTNTVKFAYTMGISAHWATFE